MTNIQVDGDANINASAFGNENQIVSEVGTIGGHLIQALNSDVHIGNKTIINQIIQQAAKQIITAPYKFLASYDICDRDISRAFSLIAFALQESRQDRELAALLARHIYLFNLGHVLMRSQIDDAFRMLMPTIFHSPQSISNPSSEDSADELAAQICQQIQLKVSLTQQEWERFIGTEIPYEPTCPERPESVPLRLRNEAMNTDDLLSLSLNLHEKSDGWGHPTRDVVNKFESRGDVIIDKATGLMWQKSGAPKKLTYDQAQHYLAVDRTGGYADWRLPTIEELLSLVELEKMPNLYINSMFFDETQKWVWSADSRIKRENLKWAIWIVSIRFGYVRLYNADEESWVRGVRSEQ